MIHHGSLHVHGGLGSSGLRRGDKRGPLLQVHVVHHQQTHMAIDARPGEPARGRLLLVIGAHGEHVLLAGGVEMAGQFVAEAHIPIGPLAERKTVDPNFAVGNYAIELHEHAARRGIGGRHQGTLPAPPSPRGAAATGGSTKCLRYQPSPEGTNAPAPRAGAFSSKGPSMPQSWGRLTERQAESANSGLSAPGASAFRKRQPESNGTVVRGAAASGITARRNTVSFIVLSLPRPQRRRYRRPCWSGTLPTCDPA